MQTEELEGALVISVAGRIDGVNAQEFQENLDQKSESSSDSPAIVLDLENLSYISSAGLRSILLIAKTLKSKQIKFAMCSLPDPIMEIIQITGFDKIIDIHESRSVAVTATTG
ncbi:MAG: STAS domain-containing protein [Gammaproteobacteria bacterium]|nr:STAS domain-containing protein [Gammaproteobacteria bacterium]